MILFLILQKSVTKFIRTKNYHLKLIGIVSDVPD